MSGAPVDERGNYSSVGELYARIRLGFETIPEEQLFIGDKNRQLGASEVDFPDIVRVVSRQTAVEAIRMIVEQGEGTESDSQNAHYGVFVGVLNEYEAENKRSRADGRPFVPVRPAATNPVMPEQLVQPGGDVTPLVGDYALGVAALFDELYILMLRQLQFVFTTGRSSDARFSWFLRTAIQIMPVVIKPLGEALTLIPTEGRAGETAGATFRLIRQ